MGIIKGFVGTGLSSPATHKIVRVVLSSLVSISATVTSGIIIVHAQCISGRYEHPMSLLLAAHNEKGSISVAISVPAGMLGHPTLYVSGLPVTRILLLSMLSPLCTLDSSGLYGLIFLFLRE